MSYRRRNEFEIEQTIFLGGQISHKYKDFQDIARMSPDFAEIYMILKKLPEWEKMTDDMQLAMQIIEVLGEVDFIRGCTELTRLSAILGDYRKRYSMKDAKDVTKTASEDSEP